MLAEIGDAGNGLLRCRCSSGWHTDSRVFNATGVGVAWRRHRRMRGLRMKLQPGSFQVSVAPSFRIASYESHHVQNLCEVICLQLFQLFLRPQVL